MSNPELRDRTGTVVFVVHSQSPDLSAVVGVFTREETAVAAARAEVVALLGTDEQSEVRATETDATGNAVRQWQDDSGAWSVWYETVLLDRNPPYQPV